MTKDPAPSKKTASKKVQFFSVYLLSKGQRHDLTDLDWCTLMKSVAQVPVKERTLSQGIVFDPRVDDDGTPTLSIFRPLSTDFMSRIDPDTMEVTDIASNEKDLFAHSTAVVFIPGMPVFGLVGSSGTYSPQHSAVHTFLTTFMKPDIGSHWKVEPLMDPGKIKEFEQASGIAEFSAVYRSAGDILTPEPGNALELADRIAEVLGADVEVSLSVKLKGNKQKGPAKKLKNLVSSSLPRLTHDEKSRARVKATGGMFEDELNLVAQKFSVEGTIPEAASEEATFTLLMELAKDVTAQCESRIKELREG